MKRGTPEHIKTERLMRRLGCDLAKTVGMLELLWHLTSRFAPLGDLGAKLDDQEIARRVAWAGDHEQLIVALVDIGWLHYHEKHRLVVHDWHDHCDDWIKLRVKRSQEKGGPGFCSVGIYESCPTLFDNVHVVALPSLASPCLATATASEAAAVVAAVKLLEEREIPFARARQAVEIHGPDGIATILAWFGRELPRGTFETPKAALKSLLTEPEKWDFGRDDAGRLVAPKGGDGKPRREPTILERAHAQLHAQVSGRDQGDDRLRRFAERYGAGEDYTLLAGEWAKCLTSQPKGEPCRLLN